MITDELSRLWNDQSEWSQATFGTDLQRGPRGPLKHLLKEAGEAIESPRDITEYADCLLLIMDATRRAGFSLHQLIEAAAAKQRVNRSRAWPPPKFDDEPTEHVEDDIGAEVMGGVRGRAPATNWMQL